MESKNRFAVAALAVFACSAVLAADKKEASQPVDPEVASNNVRYASLMLDIQASYDWGTAKLSKPKFSRIKFYHKEKNLPLLSSNINTMVSLVRAGKFTATTEFALKRLYATAIAEPMDLRYYKEAVAAYDEAIRLAPDDKARNALVIAKARYELKAAQVDPAGPTKILEDLYQSYTDAEKLAQIGNFPGHSYDGPEGRELSEKVGADALARWYARQVENNRSRPINPDDPLDVRNSFDYKLAMCDEAIAKFPDRKDQFLRAKCVLWLAMKDFASVEKVYRETLQKAPADKPLARFDALHNLGKLYAARAERYYADPDEKLSRTALGFWDEAMKLVEGQDAKKVLGARPWLFNVSDHGVEPEFFTAPVRQAIMIRDYKFASEWLDRTAKVKGEKAAKDPWICGCRGDLAYYAGDWAEAVKWYETPEKDFKDGPSRIPYPNSHQRYAGALNAIGEHAKCLEALKKCPNMGTFRALNDYNRRILEIKCK